MTGTFDHPFAVNHIILSNGCKLAYIDEGKGDKVLLFVHGLATYALSWQKNIEYLKQYYRCMAIDLPGNGFSERGDYPYSIEFFSGCLYDFIQKLHLGQVILAGHSMGGQIIMNLAIKEPSCADKMILCAPAGFEVFTPLEKNLYRSTVGLFDIFSSDESSLRNTLYASFYRHRQQSEAMINELVQLMRSYPAKQYRDMIDKCIQGMLYETVFDRLPLIRQQVLVMFGEYDALIPNKFIHHTSTRHIAEEGAKRIPAATLKMIPQCGHFLQIEKAAEVNNYIHSFIEG